MLTIRKELMLTPTIDAELEALLRDPWIEGASAEAKRLYNLTTAYTVFPPTLEQESSLLTELEAVHRDTNSETVRMSVFRTICIVAGYGSDPKATQQARQWLTQLTFPELAEKCGSVGAIPSLTLFAFLESKRDPKTQTAAIAEIVNRLEKWPALRNSLPARELFPEAVTA
jgi:hypothetical protein